MRNPSDRPVGQDNPAVAPSMAGPRPQDARLKAALKANMARRKAQAKARGADGAPGDLNGKD